MAALLDRADQAVSVTTMARGFSAKLKEISSRTTDRLVIFKDNQPAAVILNVDAYQELMDELENLRIDAIALDILPHLALSGAGLRRKGRGFPTVSVGASRLITSMGSCCWRH